MTLGITAVHNITARFSGDQRFLCKAGTLSQPSPYKPAFTCSLASAIFRCLFFAFRSTFTSYLNKMKLSFADYWSACIEGPAGLAKQPLAWQPAS